MRGMRHLPVALATTAAVICAAGWYISTHADAERDFDLCRRSDGSLTLTYAHGPGDGVSLSRVPRGNGDVTVSYRVKDPGGISVLMGIISTVEFRDLGGKVFYPDGREITCDESDPGGGEVGPAGQ